MKNSTSKVDINEHLSQYDLFVLLEFLDIKGYMKVTGSPPFYIIKKVQLFFAHEKKLIKNCFSI